MEILRCTDVGLTQKGQPILQHISFAVEKGERVGISGPSGAGKTSLLRLLNLLRSPTSGTILYQGKALPAYAPTQLRREIGYVLQKPYLFHGTVRENLDYPYLVWKLPPDTREIQDYLARVNLPGSILDKHGAEMSGGEQQRVALVRSLLAKPNVLLLDEISASLDEENTRLIEQCLLEECAHRPVTVLFISHSKPQLQRLAQKILVLDRGCLRFFIPAWEFFAPQGETTDA